MIRYKHKAAREEEFPCFLVTSIGVHDAIATSQKANLSLPRNVYCVRTEQGLPPHSDARGAEAIELPQETSDPKRPQASGPRNKKKLRKSGRRVHDCKTRFSPKKQRSVISLMEFFSTEKRNGAVCLASAC